MINYIWLPIGIIYLLVQMQKEYKVINKSTVLLLIIFATWGIIPSGLAYIIGGATAADIVSVITFLVPMLILCIYMILKQK